jgi:transcriptional regulator with XRE-family HTH domain
MSSVHSARYKRFLRRLRAARQEVGLTQADVAKAFGRPQSFVSKCESGERRVDVLELGEFAELYGRPLSFFVAETDKADEPATRRRRRRE